MFFFARQMLILFHCALGMQSTSAVINGSPGPPVPETQTEVQEWKSWGPFPILTPFDNPAKEVIRCMMYCQIHNKQTGTTESEKIFFMLSFSLLKCNNHTFIYLGSKNLTFHSPWFLCWHTENQPRKLSMQMMVIWGKIHFKWKIWIYKLHICIRICMYICVYTYIWNNNECLPFVYNVWGVVLTFMCINSFNLSNNLQSSYYYYSDFKD